MAKIMIQGTGSSVGKSILVTALCRIFKQDGYTVCPYKSQNMALNSYITHDGKEMGRAQVLQAYAAGLEPEAYMNPILLKPTGDKKSQIIFNGEVYGNSTAMEYHNMKTKFGKKLKEQFKDIEEKFDIVVIEGAGSPAEINLRDKDIVNMGFAEMVDAPVLLAGDIDRGGVFASLAGTMLLLTEEEKKRVKGTLINKFRGDIEILKPGLKMLEDIIKRPTVGVVPYLKLQLEDEDGAVEFNRNINAPIDIAVIKLPRISNFTDFDALKIEEDVSIRYITTKEDFGNPDLLIIPGTKNTIEDLLELRKCGLEDKIKEYSKTGTVIGICGGYQMLGKTLKDPYKVESDELETEGMGLLNVDTVFEKEKITTRVKAKSKDTEVYGYEIHMGICTYKEGAKPLFSIYDENGKKVNRQDGAINEKENVMGTYIHGVFDGVEFREKVLNNIRKIKGIEEKKAIQYENLREKNLDMLADLVRKNVDMDYIYKIMGM
ncbi:cobyric acid synthase [Clostridium cochlearium]|uniref:Cobyric acid synthase n=1 Tax=Clostridium cochlearium TaxID=1494 RepID=A0ABY0QIF9_CLOCO|nr:cobyric acid synthase [Clostridium cochlearium]MCG4571150.1 cobyric acid synthase [Clostridium cochlearium]MCR1971447.1 cobyric acid synthase [Clostridium cochlearium]SDK85867.1 adenosylcobyric acid synthase (glutamine-hydrolysing) [Clostridium cochlearium]SNV70413.1 cobyric acid synthase [Clostridium cochlearium]STA91925.1 cobyric acid synthase [Clostridium cochlearium]